MTTWIVGRIVGIVILVGIGPFVGRMAGVDVGISEGSVGPVSQSAGVGSIGCSIGCGSDGGTKDTRVGSLNDCKALRIDVPEFESD